jgi:hypothetical protein
MDEISAGNTQALRALGQDSAEDEKADFINACVADYIALTQEYFHKFHGKLMVPKVDKDALELLERPEYHHFIELWDPK